MRRCLQRVHHRLPYGLELREGGVHGRLPREARGQGDGVLEGELGARADGEVGGVERVAEQHHVAVPPALVLDDHEAQPLDEVVGEEGLALELAREDALEAARVSASSISSKPARSHASPTASTMKVLVSGPNR